MSAAAICQGRFRHIRASLITSTSVAEPAKTVLKAAAAFAWWTAGDVASPCLQETVTGPQMSDECSRELHPIWTQVWRPLGRRERRTNLGRELMGYLWPHILCLFFTTLHDNAYFVLTPVLTLQHVAWLPYGRCWFISHCMSCCPLEEHVGKRLLHFILNK